MVESSMASPQKDMLVGTVPGAATTNSMRALRMGASLGMVTF